MVLVLCIGDLHVPQGAVDLPPQFKKLLVPGKIHHVLCTGNVVIKEVHDYLKTVCSDLNIVKGEFDTLPDLPEDKVLQVGDVKIGLLHGHQVVPTGSSAKLGLVARQMGVDILVTGQTHEFKAEKVEGRLLLNPGSATGAPTVYKDDVHPSFVLMDISGTKATLYIYELKNGEVVISKEEFSCTAAAA
jgi:vacuolar protein sorting-associated protein 29